MSGNENLYCILVYYFIYIINFINARNFVEILEFIAILFSGSSHVKAMH